MSSPVGDAVSAGEAGLRRLQAMWRCRTLTFLYPRGHRFLLRPALRRPRAEDDRAVEALRFIDVA